MKVLKRVKLEILFANDIILSAMLNKMEKIVYTCPMHPNAKSDKPGRCPECDMNLVENNSTKDSSHDKH